MEDVKSTKQPRPYRSLVREEGARRTRRAVVLAALTLFEERGYGRTSLSQVAAAAGVARPTVTAAFGSKPALLRQVVDEALAGDDEPVPVADRLWFRPVWQAQTPVELFDAYAQVSTVIGARTARLFEVVHQAADASPDVADLWASIQRNRRAGARKVIDQLHSLRSADGWRAGDRAVDALGVFNDPALYNSLVVQCGWSEPEFTVWLAARMQDALLDR